MAALSWAGWTLDWSTTAVLAGITLLEGLRRVPAGAVVLTRMGNNPWAVSRTTAGVRLELVSWAAPLILHLLVSPSIATAPPRDLRHRWRHVRRWQLVLRLVGGAEWCWVVIGIPLMTDRWGALGLLVAVMLAFQGALLLTILSACALAKLRLTPRTILVSVVDCCRHLRRRAPLKWSLKSRSPACHPLRSCACSYRPTHLLRGCGHERTMTHRQAWMLSWWRASHARSSRRCLRTRASSRARPTARAADIPTGLTSRLAPYAML